MSTNIKQIKLVNILNVKPEVSDAIRYIRNEDNVRKWMYTDHVISASEHTAWLEKLQHDSRNIVFAVMNSDNEPLGVVSVNAIDMQHKKAEWAYYLTEQVRSGVGAVLEYYILEYIFGKLGIEKLNCEVIEHNDAVVKLHEKFGFKKEGFRESNIIKYNQRLGVHYLGLTRLHWQDIRNTIKNKYSKIFSQYEIKVAD
ncbi:UDP-4-amino-4,6-dideoxy-N-acetyl-beta-L-altrosamine N-acetyltransferase [Scandinavium goeteborgense]|uniref:UDP-4-amino-4, 6-dideoxy-N-acetyl-beta-L-altrosamine N-acetyltransferase n=1 Tax=Scandinavium goeteborgense TaxID=1851514 RepID=A0A4R6EEG3_SCAGO|nr:UDP-4-amino-4,6-dideoxy-N-acetyl-beta-L-altrosamine N-acetyltransferase [Scandinavium goeteborgense]TDN55628.1 UDP-4-amino-4,6-dideoxy-N-acetyl-beta-L-altrosamine N-acetyltransferase [Scandinavium goeteborgense]